MTCRKLLSGETFTMHKSTAMFAKYIVLVYCLLAGAAASHFRFGSLSWSRDTSSPGYTIKLKVHFAYRRGFFRPQRNVGDEFYGGRIKWGDGKSSTCGPLKVNPGGVYTADSAADEWTDATGEMTHTYSQDFIDKNLADWEIYLSSCCRISTLMKNKNSGYKVYTVVPALEFLNNKAGPSMNVFPLLTIPIQKGIVTQEIAASDPYGADKLTFAWASKKYACGCTTCSCALPNTYKGSLAINASTGALSWDTDALGKSDVGTYPVQVKVTNNKGSVSVVDFIINLIDSSPKYFCALTGTRCDKDFGCGTRSVVTKKTVSTWHYSDNKKYQNLYLASPILDVRLLQKRGAVKSLPGKNWGFTSKSIWTSGKFRGKFEVKYGKNDTAHDLTLVKKGKICFFRGLRYKRVPSVCRIQFMGVYRDKQTRAIPGGMDRVRPNTDENRKKKLEAFIQELSKRGEKVGYYAIQNGNQVFKTVGDQMNLDYEKYGLVDAQKSSGRFSENSLGLSIDGCVGAVNVAGGSWENAVYRITLGGAPLYRRTKYIEIHNRYYFNSKRKIEFDKMSIVDGNDTKVSVSSDATVSCSGTCPTGIKAAALAALDPSSVTEGPRSTKGKSVTLTVTLKDTLVVKKIEFSEVPKSMYRTYVQLYDSEHSLIHTKVIRYRGSGKKNQPLTFATTKTVGKYVEGNAIDCHNQLKAAKTPAPFMQMIGRYCYVPYYNKTYVEGDMPDLFCNQYGAKWYTWSMLDLYMRKGANNECVKDASPTFEGVPQSLIRKNEGDILEFEINVTDVNTLTSVSLMGSDIPTGANFRPHPKHISRSFQNGRCVLQNDKYDVSSGVYQLDTLSNGLGDSRLEECLAKCKNYTIHGDPTGCQIVYNKKRNDGCFVHTKPVSHSKGDTEYTKCAIILENAKMSPVFDAGGIGKISGTFSWAIPQGSVGAYNIMLEARSGLSDEMPVYRSLKILVTQINAPPTDIVASPAGVLYVHEHAVPGTRVASLTTVDVNAGDTHEYVLSDNANGKFDITSNILRVGQQTIDFESLQTTTLEVKVRASDGKGGNITKIFKIQIVDVNESPTDILLSNTTIPENAPKGTLVGLLSAVDPDRHLYNWWKRDFYIETRGAMHLWLKIEGNRLIQNVNAFDFERVKELSVFVKVVDSGGLSLSKKVTVNILDVNEPPTAILIGGAIQILSAEYGTNCLPESHYCNASNSNCQCLRPMCMDLKLKCNGRSYCDYNITNAPAYKKETHADGCKNDYFVIYRCGSTGHEQTLHMTGNQMAAGTVTISCTTHGTIAENSAAGAVVANLSAVDPDVDQTFQFSIVSKEMSNYAFMLEANALVTNSTEPLNYELNRALLVDILVVDSGVPALSYQQSVLVNIENVQEAPLLNPDSFSVLEQSLVGTIVGTVKATADSAYSEGIKFSIVGGSQSDYFGIHSCSGVLFVKRRVPYQNDIGSHTITVQAETEKPVTATITINVNRPNQAPVVPLVDVKVAVRENVKQGFSVVALPLYASDPDGDDMTFTLLEGNEENLFYIENLHSNNLTMSSNRLNFEAKGTHRLAVRVSDTAGLFSIFIVEIEVIDQNDPPYLRDGYSRISENAAFGHNVGKLEVVDEDTRNQQFTFHILSGNDGDAFRINSVTGELTVNDPNTLDFESDRRVYAIVVSASDHSNAFGGNSGHVRSFSLVNISGSVGGNATLRKAAKLPLEESLPTSGTQIATGRIINNQIVIHFTEALTSRGAYPHIDDFTVLVEMKVAAIDSVAIDATDNRKLVLSMQTGVSLGAGDKHVAVHYMHFGANQTSNAATIHVAVEDANDAPDLKLSNVSFLVSESAVPQQYFSDPLLLHTFDQDERTMFSYMLGNTTGGEANIFYINPTDGRLGTFGGYHQLDYESKATYNLIVRVEDNNGLSAEAAIVVQVVDVNEEPELPHMINRYVSEGEAAGSHATVDTSGVYIDGAEVENQFCGSDEDGGQNGLLNISLTDTIDGKFILSKSNLNMSLFCYFINITEKLDFEDSAFPPLQHFYEPTIEATDGGQPRLLETVSARINVVNKNEPPLFLPGPLAINLPSNTPVNSEFGPVLFATDPDMPDTIKYTLDSDVYALRNISKGKNGASLVLKSGSVSGSYNLKIYANDTLGSYGTLDVVITIINTNNAPNVSSDTFMIEENIASGAFIGSVQSVDYNGDRMAFAISSGNEEKLFSIEPSSGNIKYAPSGLQTIDFERSTTYSLMVQVTDDNESPLHSYGVITIEVLNVNEAPYIKGAQLYEKEGFPKGCLHTVGAADVDKNDKLRFSIRAPPSTLAMSTTNSLPGYNSNGTKFKSEHVQTVSSANEAAYNVPLRIDAVTGKIYATEPFNFEVRQEHRFVVSVRDTEGASASAYFVLFVSDVNERPRLLPQTFYVMENSPAGTTIGHALSYEDEDNGQLHNFEILSGNTNNLFTLSKSGVLSVESGEQLDFENSKFYSLKIRITDSGLKMQNRLSSSAEVKINVLDENEPPVFPERVSHIRYVSERSQPGELVGNPVIAADPDQSQSLVYSLRQSNLAASDQCSCSGMSPCKEKDGTPPSCIAKRFSKESEWRCPSDTIDCSGGRPSSVELDKLRDIKWKILFRQTYETLCNKPLGVNLVSDKNNSMLVLGGILNPVSSGILVAVIEDGTFSIETFAIFDIYGDDSENKNLVKFLRSIENGKIVFIVSNSRPFEYDNVPRHIKRRVVKQIKKVGGSDSFRYHHLDNHHAFVLAGRKGANAGSVPQRLAYKSNVELSCADMDSFTISFNDRGNSVLDTTKTYSYHYPNFQVDLKGWTHSRKKYDGFSLEKGGAASATVRGLVPHSIYTYDIYQRSDTTESGKRFVYVNGKSVTTERPSSNNLPSVSGDARSNSEGEISFLFSHENFYVSLSALKIKAREADPSSFLRVNPGNPSAALYSILDHIENYRNLDGTFIFKLVWPKMKFDAATSTNSIVWRQTTNPINADELLCEIEFLGIWKDNKDSRVFPGDGKRVTTDMGSTIANFVNSVRDDGAVSGVFAIQDGDQVWTSIDENLSYKIHGKISNQKATGPRSNNNLGITTSNCQGTVNVAGGYLQNAIYKVSIGAAVKGLEVSNQQFKNFQGLSRTRRAGNYVNPTGRQRTYSSVHEDSSLYSQSRLHSPAAWSPKNNKTGEWIQIDAGKVKNIAGVVTQGHKTNFPSEFVTQYTVKYSLDGASWTNVDSGASFQGNKNRNIIAKSIFLNAINARYIRIYPQKWEGTRISMRLGFVVAALRMPFISSNNGQFAIGATDYLADGIPGGVLGRGESQVELYVAKLSNPSNALSQQPQFSIDAKSGQIYTSGYGSLDFETVAMYTLEVTAWDNGHIFYGGTANKTEQGYRCQHWQLDTPTPNIYASALTDGTSPFKDTLLDHNFCRNPGGVRDRAWCFTVDGPFPNWGYCQVDALQRFSTVNVNVVVNDLNDPPVADYDGFTVSIAENAVIGSTITTARASDPDDKTFEFAIVGSTGSIPFRISPTGQLTVSNILDFESTRTYTIPIEVTDRVRNEMALSAIGYIHVNILNVNEPPVLFDATRFIYEDAGEGETLGPALQALDPDEEASLNYFIVSRDDQYVFNLEACSGQLRLQVGNVLDAETKPMYVLGVEVKDGGSPTLSAQSSVSIHVNFTNRLPVFSQNEYHFSISENFVPGSYVGTVQATDRDMNPDDNGYLDELFVGTSTAASKWIENSNNYSACSRFSSGAEGGLKEFDIEVDNDFIKVTREDETADQGWANQMTLLCTTSAELLYYSMSSENNDGTFTIHRTTGQIFVNNSIDFETMSSYSLKAESYDREGVVSVTLKIDIVDENEAPIILNGTILHLHENALIGTVARGTIPVLDPDNGQTVRASILSCQSNVSCTGLFGVNKVTREVYLASGTLDFEHVQEYKLSIAFADSHPTSPKTTIANVIMKVTDVNEVPTFTDFTHIKNEVPVYELSLPEITADSLINVNANSSTGAINVLNIKYGANCGVTANHGSSLQSVKAQCDGKSTCDFVIRNELLGNPAPSCGKLFQVTYRCRQGATHTAEEKEQKESIKADTIKEIEKRTAEKEAEETRKSNEQAKKTKEQTRKQNKREEVKKQNEASDDDTTVVVDTDGNMEKVANTEDDSK